MGKKMTFDELLARKEQREADRMRIGEITVPGTDQVLEVRTPGDKAVMSIYGSLMGAESPEDALAASRKAIYDCCPALQDGKLHAAGETSHCFLDRKMMPVHLKRDYPEIYNRLVAYMGD